MAPRRKEKTPELEPAADLSATPDDTSSGRWVTVHTPYGVVQMTPEGAAKYEAETEAAYAERRDVDDLAMAWDASMGGPTATPREPQSMNGQNAAIDPDVLALFQQYLQEGRLPELFQPFQQEQSVLNQEMQLAEGLRQNGPQRSTPTGALFGGLARAAGNIGAAAMQRKGLEGQTALGKRMQGDASGRTEAILRAAMKRRGMNPDTGLMDTAVDDATLSQIFSGG